MKTFVRKLDLDAVHVIAVGETVVLDNGNKIPYGNLPLYTPQELLLFNIYAFEPPVVPVGEYLVSISYVATAEGVDQIPVFAPLPPGPVHALANAAAAGSYIASLRRQARRYEMAGQVSKSVDLFLKAAGVQRW